MSSTVLVILSLVIMIGCAVIALTKKVPTWVPFVVVPPVIALIAGFGPSDVSSWIHSSCQGGVTAVLNILFAISFFTILNKSGLFDVIISKLLSLIKGNVYLIYMIALLLGCIGQLSASSMTAIFIAVPAMTPMFKKMHLDRRKMFLVIMMGAMPMNMLPWGTPTSLSAYSPELDPGVLSNHAIPVFIFTYVMYIAFTLWFAKRDYTKNKAYIDSIRDELISDGKVSKNEIKWTSPELARPKLFWVNVGLLLLVLAGCIFMSDVRSYIFFGLGTAIAGCINYKPKDFDGIVKEVGTGSVNAIVLVFSITFMTGILNSSGMMESLSTIIIEAVPNALLRVFPAFWGWIRPVLDCFIPYQAWTSIPPLLISIGTGIGLTVNQVATTQFINCIGGVPCSPMMAPVQVGCELADIDLMDNLKHSLKYCVFFNLAATVFAFIIGVI